MNSKAKNLRARGKRAATNQYKAAPRPISHDARNDQLPPLAKRLISLQNFVLLMMIITLPLARPDFMYPAEVLASVDVPLGITLPPYINSVLFVVVAIFNILFSLMLLHGRDALIRIAAIWIGALAHCYIVFVM